MKNYRIGEIDNRLRDVGYTLGCVRNGNSDLSMLKNTAAALYNTIACIEAQEREDMEHIRNQNRQRVDEMVRNFRDNQYD